MIKIILLFFSSFLLKAQQETIKSENILRLYKTPISGVVLTPTAYRSYGINELGTSIDINATYYIGRIYSKNEFSWSVDKKNYLDRIGLWYLETDGKILVQTEKKLVPAFSTGVKGSFSFRDSPQPNLNSPSASFKVSSKSTEKLFSMYFVASKKIYKNLFSSIGYSTGDMGKTIYMLSEFLSERSSQLTYNKDRSISDSTIFLNTFIVVREKNIIGFEVIIPQGSTFSPKLINLQLANFLKLNFQLSYLTYDGGKEILGMFNFRYSFYPRIKNF